MVEFDDGRLNLEKDLIKINGVELPIYQLNSARTRQSQMTLNPKDRDRGLHTVEGMPSQNLLNAQRQSHQVLSTQ